MQLYFQTKTPDAADERRLFSGVMRGVPPSLAWRSEVRGDALPRLTVRMCSHHRAFSLSLSFRI